MNDNTGLLMKQVHTSNYSIEGFTKAVDEATLAEIGHELNIPVVADLGSGSLVDLSRYGLPKEPIPQEMIAAGVSLVSFSGDKLLGGPQAGIIVGKSADRPFAEPPAPGAPCESDKMTLAALGGDAAPLSASGKAAAELPTLRLLTRQADEIRLQGERIQAALAAHYADFDLQG